MNININDTITIRAKGVTKIGKVIYAYYDGEFWDIETDNFHWKQMFDGGEIINVK